VSDLESQEIVDEGRWRDGRGVVRPRRRRAGQFAERRASVAVTPGTLYSRIADAVLRTDRLIKTVRVVSAEGAGGQKLYIFPDYRLLVAFTERNYSTPPVGPIFLKESVLPALR
jgi:hypothetical protein